MAVADDSRAELRQAAHDWLCRRGVPHFLGVPEENEHRLFEAVLLLVAAVAYASFVVSTPEVDRRFDVALTAGVFILALALIMERRRRSPDHDRLLPPPWQLRASVAAAVVAAPMSDAIVTGDVRTASGVTVGAAMLGVVVVAAATPLAALRIVWWAVGHPVRELGQTLRVLAGAIPLLLLTVAFLFLTNELWQVATDLTLGEFLGTLGLFAVLAVGFLGVRTRDHVAQANAFRTWQEVEEAMRHGNERGALDRLLGRARVPDRALEAIFRRQRGTRKLLERLISRSPWGQLRPVCDVPALNWRERWNLALVSMFGQSVQALAVTAMMVIFFLLFGWLTVDENTLKAWRVPAEDGWHIWTRQHLQVAGLISAFAGLSFIVYAALIKEQRELFFGPLDQKIRQRLAVRALHWALQPSAPPGARAIQA